MENKPDFSSKRLLLIISKLIASFIALLTVVIVVLVLYFNYNKVSISTNLVSHINKEIQGNLVFKNIIFSPLAQFPHISISLVDVCYYNNTIFENNKVNDSIVKLEKVHLAFNILSLFTNNIHIYGVELENGNIDLIRYPDSTMNFINALKSVNNNQKYNYVEKDTTTAISKEIYLSLDYIKLENIGLQYVDKLNKSNVCVHINEINASYENTNDTIRFQIDSEIDLEHIPIYNNIEINNSSLSFKTGILWVVSDSILQFEMANIKLDKSIFKGSGVINFSKHKDLNIELSLYDNDLSIINYFLSEQGIENIEKGSVNFNGSINYNFINQSPDIDCKFGFEDIKIADPSSNKYIENLNLSGSLKTGDTGDLTDASFIIDTLYGTTQDGKIDASFMVENFVLPKFTTNIDTDLNLDGLDKVIGTRVFEDPIGDISMRMQLAGEKIDDTTWIIPGTEKFDMHFDGISCKIPGLLELKKLNGNISGSLNNIILNELEIIAGNSDFYINGEVVNITQLIQGGSAVPEARLKIKSNRFDLPESMSWIPTVRKDFKDVFPYSIINIDLEAIATITKEAINNFTYIPEMHIDVPYCNAQIDEFLPPVKVSNGFLQFEEIGMGYSIDINDFDILFKKAKLRGGCTYYDRRNTYDSLDIHANISALNPNYILDYYSSNSSKSFDSLDIAGNIIFQMNFSGFDTIKEKTFAKVIMQSMVLKQPQDTIYCNSINIDIGEVFYNSNANKGPLSVLSANINLALVSLTSSNFDLKEVNTKIEVDKGVFDVGIFSRSSLIKQGKGNFVIAPFVETPYFQFDYTIEKFRFENLFEKLNQPPMIKGNLGASLKIEGKGIGWQQLSNSIKGNIDFKGNNLILMGINLDKMIHKLNRTQNFSLADIGAVMVAGPVGLLVTKGADVSRLLINNRKDSTKIIQLVSDWEINNGIMEIDDVAISTPKNRVAVKGKYSIPTDSIAFVIAVVDKKGIIELHQTISGTSKKPSLDDIKPLKTILKPVGNLFDDMLFIKGQTFYDGQVKPPE